jgi:hypothetical protein
LVFGKKDDLVFGRGALASSPSLSRPVIDTLSSSPLAHPLHTLFLFLRLVRFSSPAAAASSPPQLPPLLASQVERVKEIPIEVEKVVYSEKIIPQEVVIDVPKVAVSSIPSTQMFSPL